MSAEVAHRCASSGSHDVVVEIELRALMWRRLQIYAEPTPHWQPPSDNDHTTFRFASTTRVR